MSTSVYLEKPDRIIIFRALQLGDMLCCIPAVRALRHAFPYAEITLTGLPWAESLVKRFPDYFNRFIRFPGYPGLPEQPFLPERFVSFLYEMQSLNADLVLQMQGNGSIVNPMVELFGARQQAGFYLKGHYYRDNGLFLEYPGSIHEIERHLQLMKHLGIPQQGKDLEFPLFPKDYEDFQKADIPVEPGKYVCIHPGSRGVSRRWPPKYFAALADMAVENGFQAVITGTKDEIFIVKQVADAMKYKPVIAAGETSLGAVAVLIKQAYALFSNCTGVSHIASALQTPSVVISMDGEASRWKPLNDALHITFDWTKSPVFDEVAEGTLKLLNNKKQPKLLQEGII